MDNKITYNETLGLLDWLLDYEPCKKTWPFCEAWDLIEGIVNREKFDVERFNKTVLDEFFRTAFRKKQYDSVVTLQEDLDKWLHHYITMSGPTEGIVTKGIGPLKRLKWD